MSENWEIYWKDYYEILQVHPSAEPEVIKAAYDRLARKYHPDVTDGYASGDRIAEINEAFSVLSDPEKRAAFDKDWRQRQGMTWSPPRPTAIPLILHFDNVEARSIVRSSFVLQNSGGPYTRPVIQDPGSWLRVVKADPVHPGQAEPLPARIEIEAEGQDWDSKYSGYIMVRLVNEEARIMGETRVKVELNTKPQPEGQDSSRGPSVPRAERPAPQLQHGFVYLLVDCSGSMAGSKLEHAKRGAADFASDAARRGYSIGLIEFYGIAKHICEPTNDVALIQRHIARLRAKKAGRVRAFLAVFSRGIYGTNIAAAVGLARRRLSQKEGAKAIVVITDGQPNSRGDPDRSLKAGERARSEGIDIIAIGTDRADHRFLRKLASSTELSMKVSRGTFQEAIVSSSKLLSGPR